LLVCISFDHTYFTKGQLITLQPFFLISSLTFFFLLFYTLTIIFNLKFKIKFFNSITLSSLSSRQTQGTYSIWLASYDYHLHNLIWNGANFVSFLDQRILFVINVFFTVFKQAVVLKSKRIIWWENWHRNSPMDGYIFLNYLNHFRSNSCYSNKTKFASIAACNIFLCLTVASALSTSDHGKTQNRNENWVHAWH